MPRGTQASCVWLDVLGVTLEPLAGVEDPDYLLATLHSWGPLLLAGFSGVHPPLHSFSALSLIC